MTSVSQSTPSRGGNFLSKQSHSLPLDYMNGHYISKK